MTESHVADPGSVALWRQEGHAVDMLLAPGSSILRVDTSESSNKEVRFVKGCLFYYSVLMY